MISYEVFFKDGTTKIYENPNYQYEGRIDGKAFVEIEGERLFHNDIKNVIIIEGEE